MIMASNQHGGTAQASELVRELTRHELLQLADSDDAPRVSIYLSTSRDSSVSALRIAWANLIRSAERQLKDDGGAGEARRLLAPARRVVDGRDAHARGVAYFSSDGFSRTLSVAIRVPTTAVVGGRCYLRPLLPLLEPTDRYYVLGLSRDDVRFFAGTRELVKELSLDGLPLAPLASMPRERRPAGALVADRGSTGIRGMWHGVGGVVDDLDRQRVVAHFHEVDAAVNKILRNVGAPLVLGGVGYLHALYRGVNSYPVLVPEGITGGLRDMTTKRLHQQAWPLVEPTLQVAQREALNRFTQLNGSGRTVNELSTAAEAADDGQIESLLVAAADMSRVRGADPAGTSAGKPRDDWMLFEQATAGTLRHGGAVYVLDAAAMPTSTGVAGILRY